VRQKEGDLPAANVDARGLLAKHWLAWLRDVYIAGVGGGDGQG
jgi:hypothetical protein